MAATLSILQGVSISVAKALATQKAAEKFGGLAAAGAQVAGDVHTALMEQR